MTASGKRRTSVKILHTADVHLEVSRHGKIVDGRNSRLDDLGAVLDRFADVAIKEKVDLAAIVGDLFDNRRPGPEAITRAVRPIRRLSEAKIPTVISGGNHDGQGTIADPDSHTLTWMAQLAMPYVHVLATPHAGWLPSSRGKFAVVAIPFPHKRAYDVAHPDLEIRERVELVSRDIERVIGEMRRTVGSQKVPVVFVGHLTVAGARLGHESAMRMGWDVTIRPEVLDEFDYAALGHIHLQQQISPKAWYAGSPAPLDWSDDGHQKGFLLVDVEPGRDPQVEVVDAGARPMVVVEYVEEAGAWLPNAEYRPPSGAIVKARIRPQERVSGATQAQLVRQLLDAGAFHVVPEVVLPEQANRVRVVLDPEADEIAAVEEWCRAKSVDPAKVVPVARELIASFRVAG
jgi:exonuclease SbcD